EGGGKLYRDKTSDIQGYGFNFTFDKRFNLFSGVGGGWYLVNANWKEFQNTDLLDERVNHIRVSFKGTKSTVFVNGKELYSFTDNTHGLGSPGFWVQEPSQIIKFYDIKITPE
ncbi:MAG: hypothetical protein KDC45_01145, partial [Bacteroidetes bacterium]|nr:hypothetical protein [Bacteroidota bacterium]